MEQAPRTALFASPPRPVMVPLLAGAAAALLYMLYTVVRPASIESIDTWGYAILETIGPALLLARAILIPVARLPWGLLAFGALLVPPGHLLFSIALKQGDPIRVGLLAHLFNGVFFLFAFIALLMLLRLRLPAANPSVWMDGLIGGLGTIAITSAVLIPHIPWSSPGPIAAAAAIASSLGAMLQMALLTASLAVRGQRPTFTWWVSMTAFLLLAIASASMAVSSANGTYLRGQPADALWPLAMVMIAWVAWTAGGTPAKTTPHSTLSIATPALFTLGALGVLIADRISWRPVVVVIFACLTLLMSTARMLMAVRAAVRLTRDERELSDRLAEARDDAIAAGKAKSDFMATLSHEIRTPLNAVLGLTELVLSTRLDPVQRDQVEGIRRSGGFVLDLINNLLDSAKIDSDQLVLEERPFELNEVISDVVNLLNTAARAKGLRLRVELDPALPDWVRGDVTRLRQVLTNLVGNAVKFTAKGSVSLVVRPGREIDGEPSIHIEVRDTGKGIPADKMGRLFKAYSQVDASITRLHGGTGLGLSISQAIVARMGGEIEVSSKEGAGSVFAFDARLPPEPTPLVVAQSLSGLRLVLIDSERDRAAALAARVRSWGAAVEVRIGADASAWGTSARRVDLVIIRSDRLHHTYAQLQELRSALGAGPLPAVLVTPEGFSVEQSDLGEFDAVVSTVDIGPRLRAVLARTYQLAGAARSPAAAAASGATPAGAPAAQGSGLRVLLAEDNATNRRVLQLLLERQGHAVEGVGTGREAVDALHVHAFDVVLMDLQMPDLDGLEATRIVRSQETGSRVPILALTGAVGPGDRAKCREAGMDGFLQKPISGAALAAALDDIPRPTPAGPRVKESW